MDRTRLAGLRRPQQTGLRVAGAGLLIATVPLIAVVLYRVVSPDTERLSLRRLLGLIVGFAGVGALVGIDLHGTDLAAVAAIAVPAVGYAIGPLVIIAS